MYVFTGLSSLQKLLGTEHVTEVSIRLQEEIYRVDAKQEVQHRYDGLQVQDWQELEPLAAAVFVFADAAIYIWFVLMMSALIFGLVNTLIASVMERVKELGMLRALGMKRRLVVAQVVTESALIMAVGVVIGLVLGYVAYLAIADGIDLSNFAEGADFAGIGTTLTPVFEIADFVLVASLSLVLGVLASIYPAWRAVKIEPLEALRV